MTKKNQATINKLLWTAIIALISLILFLVLPYSLKIYGDFWSWLKQFSWLSTRVIIIFGVFIALLIVLGRPTFKMFESLLLEFGVKDKINLWLSIVLNVVFGLFNGFAFTRLARFLIPELYN